MNAYMYIYICIHTHIHAYICIYKIIKKSVHQKALHSYSTDFNVQSFLYWERTNNIPRYKITSIRISLKAKGMIDCTANTLSIDRWSRESESSLNSGNLYFSMQVPSMLLRNVIKILRDNELSWIWSYYNLLVIRSIFS
jgi:hypothetical protein